MKTLFVIMLFLVSNYLSAQIKIEYTLWENKKIKNQHILWNDGNKKIENIINDQGKLIRKEYTRKGELKKTCEIKQVFIVDTFDVMNVNTGTIESVSSKGYKDVPNGLYTEYFPGSTKKRLEGTLIGEMKTGKWTQWDEAGKILYEKMYESDIRKE